MSGGERTLLRLREKCMNWGKGGSKKKRDVLVLAEDTDALFKED